MELKKNEMDQERRGGEWKTERERETERERMRKCREGWNEGKELMQMEPTGKGGGGLLICFSPASFTATLVRHFVC